MMQWYVSLNGVVVEITTIDPTDRYRPEFICGIAPTNAAVGDIVSNGSLSHPTAVPAAPASPRYVPLATIRDRVTTAGKWAAFAAALDSLPSDKRWHLLTLIEGVAPDDPDAIALLSAVGCDPAIILGV